MRTHSQDGKAPTVTSQTTRRGRTDGLVEVDGVLLCRALCIRELKALQWIPLDAFFGNGHAAGRATERLGERV